MANNPFYKAHWMEIEDERMAAYKTMFSWSPAAERLYAPAQIGEGQKVADFGCGPGHTAVELAKRVGAAGHVYALDINRTFLKQTCDHARAAGVEARVTAKACDGTAMPLAEACLDRVTARNAIMYVDDPLATFREFHRCLKAGGRLHAIEGDWYMMVMEPVPHDLWRSFVKAAAHACRTADMGRKLPAAAKDAGFADIQIQVIAEVDVEGRLLQMVENMAGYARLSGTLSDSAVDEVLTIVKGAAAADRYLAISPQFVLTARRPDGQ